MIFIGHRPQEVLQRICNQIQNITLLFYIVNLSQTLKLATKYKKIL